MSEFILIIESARLQKGRAFRRDKKAGAVHFQFFIGRFLGGDGHGVGGAGAPAFFDVEAKATVGLPLGSELADLRGRPIG